MNADKALIAWLGAAGAALVPIGAAAQSSEDVKKANNPLTPTIGFNLQDRMSADRTLMSVIRTSLSLISFGFTIAQGSLMTAIVWLVLGTVAMVGVTFGVGPLG